MREPSSKAILYAFLANFGIALAKSWGAWFTGSGSLLAEAIHSFADSGNQVLLFVGLVQSRRVADTDHPMGYGKLSYFWAFMVAIILFSLGGLFSIYEGIHKYQSPEPLNQAWVGMLILGVAIVLESASLIGCLGEIRKLRGTRSLRAWLRTTRNAELVVVLGEDIAALVGLTFAMAALLLAEWTGDARFDAFGSICIGVVLIIVSIFVAIRIKHLLVGISAEPDVQRELERIIVADPNVESLLHVITIQMGSKIMIAAKIRMRSGLSIEAAAARINALERALHAAVPALGWCFIEPDVVD